MYDLQHNLQIIIIDIISSESSNIIVVLLQTGKRCVHERVYI